MTATDSVSSTEGSSSPDPSGATVRPLRSVVEVGDEVVALAGQIASATARFLRLLAELDVREGWAGPGMHSCAHWLSWRCGTDLRTAREHVRVARALTALPRTTAEFDRGRLSYSKVRALARVATPDTEDDLVDIALAAPAAHVERLVRGLRTAAQQQDLSPAQLVEREAERLRRRRVQWRWDPETGDLVLWGRLAAQDGAALLAAMTRAEHERTRTDGPAEPPDLTAPAPADLGPALVAASSMVCDAHSAPPHAVAAEVLVHVDPDGVRQPVLQGCHAPGLGPHAMSDLALETQRLGRQRVEVDRVVVAGDGRVAAAQVGREAPGQSGGGGRG